MIGSLFQATYFSNLNKKLNNNAAKLNGKSTRQLSPNWIDANLIDAKTNMPFWNKGGMETVKGTLRQNKSSKISKSWNKSYI